MAVNRLQRHLTAGVWGVILCLWTGPAWGVTIYRVLVLSNRPADLAQVQTLVPDAFLVVEAPDQISILAGTFINQVNAQKRQAELERLGLTVTLATTTEADPPAEASPTSTPAAAPTPISSATPPTLTPTPAPQPIATATATPPPAPPAINSIDLAQRPFAVLVLNPTNDPNLVENLRRFFPNAVEVIYQQQPALITGSFTQQAQAQQQTQWLNSQGFGAVVVSTTEVSFSGSPTATPTPASGEQIWALVADPSGERLPQIQQLIPEAIPLIYDGLRVVKAGGYPNPTAAQAQVERLTAQGYEVGLFPADLDRSQPILTSAGAPAPTPVPPAAAAPAPTPALTTAAIPTEAPENAAGFIVLVPQMEGSDRLLRVQSIAPDAFERRYQDQPVIQMGTYRLRQSAEQAIEDLDQLGLPGRIVPL